MRPLAAGPAIGCDYCGSQELLPPDAAQRVAFLQRRLAELESAHQRLERAAIALAHRFERQRDVWLSGTLKAALGPLGLILALVVAPAMMKAGTIDLRELAMPLALLLQLALIVGGMVLSRAMFARAYRRKVRPRLLARAPTAPFAPLRCRVCGGPLPSPTGAFMTCVYCHATNLATEEVARERDRLLHEEIEGYRRRAAAKMATAPFEYAHVSRTGIVVGNVAGLVVGSAVLWTVVALLR